jgi:uncharacterized protein (DUF1330 family)
MAAYLIYLCQGVNNREDLEKYWQEAPATFEGHDIKLLSVYRPHELLEGDVPVEGVVLAEFPSVEAAKLWYDGPQYTEVRKHRMRGSKYIGLIVDGGRVANPDDRMPQTKKRVSESQR